MHLEKNLWVRSSRENEIPPLCNSTLLDQYAKELCNIGNVGKGTTPKIDIDKCLSLLLLLP